MSTTTTLQQVDELAPIDYAAKYKNAPFSNEQGHVEFVKHMIERNVINYAHLCQWSGQCQLGTFGGAPFKIQRKAWLAAEHVLIVHSLNGEQSTIVYDGPPHGLSVLKCDCLERMG